MAIPLNYNLRNLIVRKTTTLMTAAGIALTVAVLVGDLALVEGLSTAFKKTGHPLQALVLRKGANSEIGSVVTRQAFQTLKAKSGIAANNGGEPLASLEIVTVINLPSVDSPDGMNVTLRGLGTMGIEMRKVAIREGRWFRSGQREVVVGTSIASRYPATRIGQTLSFGRGEWVVVGVMDGARSDANSEIWGEVGQ